MQALGLDGAVAIVTGAAGGMGKVIAAVLSDAGAKVVGVELTEGNRSVRSTFASVSLAALVGE